MTQLTMRHFAAGCLLVAWIGCSESDDASSDAGDGHDRDDTCGELARRCHPYGAVAEAAECHDLGHDPSSTVAQCAAALDGCFAICPELEGGAPYDASPGDAAPGDAASEQACADYCACMIPTCGAQLGGDFTDPAACAAVCSTFAAAEIACWPTFCAAADAGTSPTHNCEHAAGRLGLDECP